MPAETSDAGAPQGLSWSWELDFGALMADITGAAPARPGPSGASPAGAGSSGADRCGSAPNGSGLPPASSSPAGQLPAVPAPAGANATSPAHLDGSGPGDPDLNDHDLNGAGRNGAGLNGAGRNRAGLNDPQPEDDDGARLPAWVLTGRVAERLAPGPDLAAWLALAPPTVLDDGDLAATAGAWRRLGAWAQAQELAAIAQIASRAAARDDDIKTGLDGRPERVPASAAAEVALELTMSQYGASWWTDLAVQLSWRLAATGRALASGTIDLSRARLIAEATGTLSDEAACAVENKVLPAAGEQTTGMLRATLRRAVIAADPAGAEERRKQAERRAKVVLYPDEDCTATLAGQQLPAVHAAAAMARIKAMARAMKSSGAGGGIDLLCAQVYLGLLLGTLPLIPPAEGAPPDDDQPTSPRTSPPGTSSRGDTPPDDTPPRTSPPGDTRPSTGPPGQQPPGHAPPGDRPAGEPHHGPGTNPHYSHRSARDAPGSDPPARKGPPPGHDPPRSDIPPPGHDPPPGHEVPQPTGDVPPPGHDPPPGHEVPQPTGNVPPPGEADAPGGEDDYPCADDASLDEWAAIGHDPDDDDRWPAPDWPALPVTIPATPIPPALSRPGGGGQPGSGQPGRTRPGLLDVSLPWQVLAGLSAAPGHLSRIGPITAAQARHLADHAANDPAAQWRIIVTTSGGTALAVTRIPRLHCRDGLAAAGPGSRDATADRHTGSGSGLIGRITLTISEELAAGQLASARSAPGSRALPGIQALTDRAAQAAATAAAQARIALAADAATVEGCAHAAASPSYRPPPRLHDYITARDLTCRFPRCRQPAWRGDLDHTIAFDDGGLTCRCNLGGLCRTHHIIKHQPDWKLIQTSPGDFIWVTPSGRTCAARPGVHPL